MLMSRWAMSGAASQVRAIDSAMHGIVAELTSAGVWTGADADRFERDWNDEVRSRLLSAAHKMDTIHFEAKD